MNGKSKPNHKHLTKDDRDYIEEALNQNMTMKDIADFLAKDPTTISKEVKLHRVENYQIALIDIRILKKKNFVRDLNELRGFVMDVIREDIVENINLIILLLLLIMIINILYLILE